eukprot:CAMPEP_0116842872 /NCGR_PEP_ID=MMETSP0418-20121206/11759_1 /TAXON_ID=1158023 /ORGANISM="Astrosyne radiata, Strain 13vi08-1A" /LENGTH=143 /DNA_ID=CAMNT_0004473533 /DNA_START=176 /DNA_END=607 /DNA_ORIENTATION=+
MAFGRIGVVRDVYIPRDFHTQQPRGFAFVEYASPDMAREAQAEMDRFVIKGHELEVVFAQKGRKTPNEMRGRPPDGPPPPRGGGGRMGFERSSSFERHKQRERDHYRDDRRGRDSRPPDRDPREPGPSEGPPPEEATNNGRPD